MKKRILSLLLAAIMICTMLPQIVAKAANELSVAPYPKVEYGYSASVQSGTIRYICQDSDNAQYFFWDYWPNPPYGSYASPQSECSTACISMALSYVGVNTTPYEILMYDYGETWAKKDWGGTTYNSIGSSASAISAAMDNYINGNGKYSPLVIHIKPYPSSGGEHHVILAGKISNDSYLVINPWSPETYTLTVTNGNASWGSYTYPIVNVHQWYNPNASICNHNYNNLGICQSTCKGEYNWESTFDTSCAGIYKVSLSGGIYLRTDKPYSASTAKSDLIKKDTEVKVLGSVTNHYETDNKWYKVSYNGVVGYTNVNNLTLVPHTCDKGTYVYYEAVHPHRSCYECSICGKVWAEAGSTNKMPSCQQCAASSEHSCNKGSYMYYEEVHPHRSCYKCSVCGKVWAADGTTNYVSSCLECQKPGKPVLTNLSGKTFQENESVTFTWAATSNTTHYNLYMQHKNSSGQWEKYDQLFYVSSGMKLTFPANEYRCYIQSYNSNCWAADGSDWLYTEGDFTYFTVAPADHLPTAVCDEVTGKENSVYVRGWAFDSDTPSKSLEIHVYVDGAFAGAGTANGSRPDVNNVYDCGNNHGFSFTVPYKVSATGKHTVEVYALNTTAGKYHRLMGPFNVTITAHTHAYTSKVTTAATCTINGVRTYTCSGCGASYTETIAATGNHNYVGMVTAEAYCGGTGTKTYTCSGCSASYTEPIPATGEHKWGAWVTTKEANCKQEGTQRRECSTCGQTQEQTIPAAGHNYGEWQKITSPTCTTPGSKVRSCSPCGNEESETIEPTGHKYISITVEPRCESQGYTQYGCWNCYDYYEDTYVPALGHQYENGYCTRCDAKDPNHIEDSSNCISGLLTSFGDNLAPVMIVLYSGETVVTTITSTDGTYSFGVAAPGTYTIEISKQNHATRTYEVTVADVNIELNLKIHLIGDINGDGKVNISDVNKANAHASKTKLLEDYELTCADTNDDGRVNISDVNKMNAHAAKTKLLW